MEPPLVTAAATLRVAIRRAHIGSRRGHEGERDCRGVMAAGRRWKVEGDPRKRRGGRGVRELGRGRRGGDTGKEGMQVGTCLTLSRLAVCAAQATLSSCWGLRSGPLTLIYFQTLQPPEPSMHHYSPHHCMHHYIIGAIKQLHPHRES